MERTRVCVVGAGVSGLPSVKACIEEGLDVICYEKNSSIGGIWNYQPGKQQEGGTVMKSTIVNTSKEMMAFSDFVPPVAYPNFMSHSLVMDYIRDYMRHFNLEQYVQLNSEVKQIKRLSNGWQVHLRDEKIEKFDKLMLCTGHHSTPKYPNFPGAKHFRGRIMHAKEYTDFQGFEDKNVFLVGIGNSSLDIAVELTKVAKSVTVSTRRGAWIFNRVAQGGMPYDVVFQSRLYHTLMRILPWSVVNDFMEHRLQQRMDHDLYGLRPDHRFFQQHPTVNDALANLMASGLIKITEDIELIEPESVLCKNGRRFPTDIIIYCTGYTFDFPYLESSSQIPIRNHEVDLYKFVFTPDMDDLAVIGLIQPIGSVAPISEMQARWAARVFAGRCQLPDSISRMEDINKKRKLMRLRYFQSDKHTLQVDFIPYMDELADFIGCKPSLFEILKSEPRFALRLFVGANFPYVYRLVGPNRWSKAKEAIWTAPQRVKKPLKNRVCRMRHHKRRGVLDEYFRYISMKWLAGYTCLILCAGFWAFCLKPASITFLAYFTQVFLFLFVFSFMLLWFDLQYDMSTIF